MGKANASDTVDCNSGGRCHVCKWNTFGHPCLHRVASVVEALACASTENQKLRREVDRYKEREITTAKMRAVWLPGGVTHLTLSSSDLALCGRGFEGSFAESAEHQFLPFVEGAHRTERYCKICKRKAIELSTVGRAFLEEKVEE